MNTPLLRIACILCTLFFSCSSISQEFDVDEADSLDFESFHSNKNKPVQIWNNGKDQKPGSSYSKHNGQRYEVREFYKTNANANEETSVFNAVSSLQRQMAQLCPQGWNKVKEWTTNATAETDYYLYYELQCR